MRWSIWDLTAAEYDDMRQLERTTKMGVAALGGVLMMGTITGDAIAQAEGDAKIEMVTLEDSLQPLIDRFNAEKDKPRILALFSPT